MPRQVGAHRGPKGPKAPPDRWKGQCRASERRKTPRAVAAREEAATIARGTGPTGQLTVLEQQAIRPATQKTYRWYALMFLDFCLTEGHTWGSPAELDWVMVLFFNVLFAEDYDSSVGATTLAAIRYLLPDVGSKKVTPLPRSDRALLGWKALLPPAQRLPLPRAAAGAIAGYMINMGRLELALFILFCFATYLRPGEAMRLRRRDVVRPQVHAGPSFAVWGLIVNNAEDGRLGKTGLMDEAVLLDKNDWLLKPLLALASLSPEDGLLWSLKMTDLRAVFYQAVQALGLGALRPQLYCLRHGGASHDLLTGVRTLAEVKARGRWAVDSSLKRYGKPTRLQAAIAVMPQGLYQYGEKVIASLADLLERAHRCGAGSLPPPRLA